MLFTRAVWEHNTRCQTKFGPGRGGTRSSAPGEQRLFDIPPSPVCPKIAPGRVHPPSGEQRLCEIPTGPGCPKMAPGPTSGRLSPALPQAPPPQDLAKGLRKSQPQNR